MAKQTKPIRRKRRLDDLFLSAEQTRTDMQGEKYHSPILIGTRAMATALSKLGTYLGY